MSEKFSRLALIRFQRMLLFELLHVALLSLQLAGGGVFVNIYPEEKKKHFVGFINMKTCQLMQRIFL